MAAEAVRSVPASAPDDPADSAQRPSIDERIRQAIERNQPAQRGTARTSGRLPGQPAASALVRRIGGMRGLAALSGALALAIGALLLHQRLRQPQESNRPAGQQSLLQPSPSARPQASRRGDNGTAAREPAKAQPTAQAVGSGRRERQPMPNPASRQEPLTDPGDPSPWRGMNNHSLIHSNPVLGAAPPPAAIATRSTWTASSDVNLRAERPLTGDNPSDQASGLKDGQPLRQPSSVDAPLITDTTPAPCPLKLPVGTN